LLQIKPQSVGLGMDYNSRNTTYEACSYGPATRRGLGTILDTAKQMNPWAWCKRPLKSLQVGSLLTAHGVEISISAARAPQQTSQAYISLNISAIMLVTSPANHANLNIFDYSAMYGSLNIPDSSIIRAKLHQSQILCTNPTPISLFQIISLNNYEKWRSKGPLSLSIFGGVQLPHIYGRPAVQLPWTWRLAAL
jgi:hypothetical protein